MPAAPGIADSAAVEEVLVPASWARETRVWLGDGADVLVAKASWDIAVGSLVFASSTPCRMWDDAKEMRPHLDARVGVDARLGRSRRRRGGWLRCAGHWSKETSPLGLDAERLARAVS